MHPKAILFVSAILIYLSYAQNRNRKSGECPPFPSVGICDMTCFSDFHCRGSQKCCRTACGGTFCTSPVSSRIVETREKAGYCPDPPTGPWVCSSRCAVDSDCRGTTKCCKNRCGALACVRPVYDLDNDIDLGD